MNIFKIALLQLNQTRDIAMNLKRGIASCRIARNLGADLALFPEMWSNGYRLPAQDAEIAEWEKQALDQQHHFIQSFKILATELDMAIGLTYLEKYHPAPRNSFLLIDRKGNFILPYSKVHTCAFSREKYLTPGADFPVCELDYKRGKVKLGAMICFDREFPESARLLMLKGAEIILVPNACEIDLNRKAQLRARAFENMTGIALANYAGLPHGGHSLAFDGIAYTSAVGEIDGSPRDMLLLEAGQKEGVYMAEFDLAALRRYRNTEVWGNAFRRPEIYSLLSSTKQQKLT
jgi:predicted amidohydrolase